MPLKLLVIGDLHGKPFCASKRTMRSFGGSFRPLNQAFTEKQLPHGDFDAILATGDFCSDEPKQLMFEAMKQRLAGGRDMIVAAVAGLLFLILSFLILRFIGVQILEIF